MLSIGWDFAFGFKRYGSEWRTERKAFHEFFHTGAANQYLPYHILEARLFLSRLLNTPEDFLHHVRQCVSVLIF